MKNYIFLFLIIGYINSYSQSWRKIVPFQNDSIYLEIGEEFNNSFLLSDSYITLNINNDGRILHLNESIRSYDLIKNNKLHRFKYNKDTIHIDVYSKDQIFENRITLISPFPDFFTGETIFYKLWFYFRRY